MPEEPEEGFVVRDRRRYLSDPEPDTPPAPVPAPPVIPVAPPTPPQGQGFASSPASAGGFGTAPLPSSAFGSASPQQAGQEFGGQPGGAFGSGMNLSADTNQPAYEEFTNSERDENDADENGPQEIPDVYSMLLVFLEQLRGLALLYMGLIQHPAAQQIGVDLEQAKVAINTIGFVVSQLEPVVAPEERIPLKALVSDLQVAFVEQARRRNAQPEPRPASPAHPGFPPMGGGIPRRRG